MNLQINVADDFFCLYIFLSLWKKKRKFYESNLILLIFVFKIKIRPKVVWFYLTNILLSSFNNPTNRLILIARDRAAHDFILLGRLKRCHITQKIMGNG